MLDGRGEQFCFGRLIENVVDYLDGIHQAGFDQRDGGIRLMIVDRNAEVVNLARRFQVFDGALPFIAAQPIGIPDVKLLQIQYGRPRFLSVVSVEVRM